MWILGRTLKCKISKIMTKNQTKWRKSESCEAFTLQSACAKEKRNTKF